MGSIFNAQYRSEVGDAATRLDPTHGQLVKDGIAGATEVARSMGRDGAPVLDAARHALVDAWAGSMWIGAAIAVIAAGLVVLLSLGRKGREDMQASARPVLDDESASPAPNPDAGTPLPHPEPEPVLVG